MSCQREALPARPAPGHQVELARFALHRFDDDGETQGFEPFAETLDQSSVAHIQARIDAADRRQGNQFTKTLHESGHAGRSCVCRQPSSLVPAICELAGRYCILSTLSLFTAIGPPIYERT